MSSSDTRSAAGASAILADMRPASLTIAALILCTGCSPGNFFSGQTPGYAATPTASPYHAYGDSITSGATLQIPQVQAYPALIADANQLYLTNNAFGGAQGCDVPASQIFGNKESPTLANSWLSTILISSTDVDVKGAGPYEAVFNLCHQAAIAWLALPLEDKILATAATVVTSGAGHLDTSYNWNAWTTDASGASLSVPFQLSAAGSLYVWYRITDGNPGTFTYALDGGTSRSATSSTTPAIAAYSGLSTSLALLRIPGVAAGAHRLTLTQTSTGGSGMGIVAIGMPPASGPTGLPRVLVGTTPTQLIGGIQDACGFTQVPCQAYIADITANVALLAGDRLNVQLFTSGKYMQGTAVDMNDYAHPNTLGQTEIAHALQDILQ